MPPLARGVLWVVGVGGRGAAVVVSRSAADGGIYGVGDGRARASYLGMGGNVWPAADGGAVWIQSAAGPSACLLRLVGLDGRPLRGPRRFPCATASDPSGGSLGLVVGGRRVVDPFSGRTVLTARWDIVAVVREKLVLAGPGTRFTLADAATGGKQRLAWPSMLWGRDEVAVDPHGRFVALAFADPAWQGGPAQALDVWLLDTETAKLTQLPGMPALVSLKATSMAWTDDGRLILLAESRGRDVVAVWRPGRRRLAIKVVRLPQRGDSGSDTFAPIR